MSLSKSNHCAKLEEMYLRCPINQSMYPSTQASFDDDEALISLEVDPTQFHAMGAAHGSVYFKLIDDASYLQRAHVKDGYLDSFDEPQFYQASDWRANRVPRKVDSQGTTNSCSRGRNQRRGG